ncbi:MAG: prenyltransferase [Elusimicrobiota bacterium]
MKNWSFLRVMVFLRWLKLPFYFLILLVAFLAGVIGLDAYGNIIIKNALFLAAAITALYFIASLTFSYHDIKKKQGPAVCMLTKREIILSNIMFLLILCFAGYGMFRQYGVPVAVLIFVLAIICYSFAGPPLSLKYHGMGEITAFLVSGPVLMCSTYFILTGTFDMSVLYLSFPVGFFFSALVLGVDLRDFHQKTSIPAKGPILYCMLLLAAYVFVMVLVPKGFLSEFSLLVLLTMPAALKNMLMVIEHEKGGTDKIVSSSAVNFAVFLILFITSIFIKIYSMDLQSIVENNF